MIAIDSQPFLIVENVGFKRLVSALEPRYSLPSRRFITETILPRIKDGITAEVRKAIEKVRWFSFTTGMWNTEVSNDSLLSSLPTSLQILSSYNQQYYMPKHFLAHTLVR